ncbi:MAG: BlaI/MecI/CopY family transcriptional regulator [Lachnospiraceae bacterium]|nr:BlaI/MecI/CopY family transcriptional regulator [Lachnospiraceae bacterium]
MKLSDGEWKLMQLLWKDAPQTITQMTKAMEKQTGWTKHTIISYLKRIEEKGAVRHETDGRTKQFYPLISEADAERQETEDFLKKVYHGKFGLMLHTMVERQSFSAEELEELSAILERAKTKTNR